MKLSEAKNLVYHQTVYIKGMYNSNGSPATCRVTGMPQTWKTDPSRVKVPVKRGLYDSGYITEKNLDEFTLRRPADRKPAKKAPKALRTPRQYYPQYGIR